MFHKKKILQKGVDKLPEIYDPEIQIKFDVIQNLINNFFNEEAALQFKEMLMDFEDYYDHEDLERIINTFAYIFTYQNNIEKAVLFYHELFNLCENSYGNQGYFVTLISKSLIAFCDTRQELDEKTDAVEYSKVTEITENKKSLLHVIYHFACISQINEKWGAAEFYLQKLIKLFGEKLKTDDFVIFWNKLATVYQMQKKFFETEQICRRTLKIINENPKVNDLIRAKTFCNYASVLQAQKRNEESKMYFLKALKIYEENLFINDKTVADILYNLGKICKNAASWNQQKNAYQYFRRALEIRKSFLDPTDLRLADVLVEISKDHNGDDDERESMLKQALEIHEYNKDSTSLQLADLFFAAAFNHIKLENENTETLYLKSLKIYEVHQNYKNCPSIYIMLGDIYEIERKYDLAEFYYQKLLKIYETDADELEQTGQALRLLVFVCKKQKKFENSLFYSFKALKLYEKEFSVYEFEISLIFSNVGSVYKKQGNFKEAIKYYEKTLEIEATNRANHFRHANALKNLGIVNQNLKNYREAELCFWQSLEICKNKSEESISAKVFFNLGKLFLIQKMYDLAERYLEEAIKLHEKNANWDCSVFCEKNFAEVLQLYIKVLIKQQKYAKAEMYGLRVLEIEESQPEAEAINTAMACNLLAIACHYQKLYDEAKNYCNQALELFDTVKPKVAEFEYAKLFATFGLIYTELADFDKAEMYFLNALIIFEFDNNTDKEDIAEINYNYGKLCERKNDNDNAEIYFLKALNLCSLKNGFKYPLKIRVLSRLGDLCFNNEKYEEAEKYYIELLNVPKYYNLNDYHKKAILKCLIKISEIQKDYQKVKNYYQSLLAQMEYMSFSSDKKAKIYYKLGRVCKFLMYYESAKKYLQKSIKFFDERLNNDDDEIITDILCELATICINQGKGAEAVEYSDRLLSIFEDNDKHDEMYIPGTIFHTVALAYKSIGKYDEAVQLCNRSIKYYKSQENYIFNNFDQDSSSLNERSDVMISEALKILIEIYIDQNKHDKIKICISRILKIFEKNIGFDFCVAAKILLIYGQICFKLKSDKELVSRLNHLLNMDPKTGDFTLLQAANLLSSLSEIYRCNKKYKDAEMLLQMAIIIFESNNFNVSELKNRLASLKNVINKTKNWSLLLFVSSLLFLTGIFCYASFYSA